MPYKVIEPGKQRFVYDLNGRRLDLGPDVLDKPERGIVDLSCERCPLVGGQFEAEGMGYSALNEAKRKAVAHLRENCGKWKERVELGRANGINIEDKPPDGFLPSR